MDQTQDVYSAMQVGEPLARFIKTIVGKVGVTVIDPFTGIPVGVILSGDQNKPDTSSYVEVWDQKALMFFRKLNKSHFDAGRLKELPVLPTPTVSPNIIADIDIDALLEAQFFTLKNRVKKFTEIPPILRIINRARELDKSEKIIKFLEESMAKMELDKVGK